jgi:hypothetical protein
MILVLTKDESIFHADTNFGVTRVGFRARTYYVMLVLCSKLLCNKYVTSVRARNNWRKIWCNSFMVIQTFKNGGKKTFPGPYVVGQRFAF